jgi:type I restriction enzyme S subunit
MAEEIYKEWFVRLRFPGHKQTRIVDGLPEEWKHAPLVKCIDILSGGTPKTEKADFWNGTIPFFTPKDCTGDLFCFDTENCISETGLGSCNSDLLPEGTIIITARGTVGNIVITGVPMAMNQSCFALRPKAEFATGYIYHFIKHTVSTLKQVANGATFDAITIRTFELTKGIIPKKDFVVLYDETVRPFLDQVKILLQKNKILKQTRDLLLPRLMSGRLTIDHLPEP